VTGVGRTVGIGAGIARQLAASGWNIAFTYWTPYDQRMTWGVEPGATDATPSGSASTASRCSRTGTLTGQGHIAHLTAPDVLADAVRDAARRVLR
jgi:3-oxoacyl-[acyl-carrier protein] reductase